MKKVAIQVRNYLEDNGDPFSNKNDVEICWDGDEGIFAGSDVPGFVEQDLFKLEYLYSYTSIKEFVNQFSISKAADLDRIGPKELERLFHLGKVELWCHIYPSEEYLIFTKKDGYMQVSDDNGMDHKLGTHLITHEDFHKYTRQYFSA